MYTAPKVVSSKEAPSGRSSALSFYGQSMEMCVRAHLFFLRSQQHELILGSNKQFCSAERMK
jgi:hypothetical protein